MIPGECLIFHAVQVMQANCQKWPGTPGAVIF